MNAAPCASCGSTSSPRPTTCASCRRAWKMPDDPHPEIQIVDMGDGTIAVHARVAKEDAGSLCSRIRTVAAAAARRSA